MSYFLRFGDFYFAAGFYPAEDGISRVVPVAKLPRAHGARVLDGYADAKEVIIRGGIIKGPFDRSAWRTRVDALKAALSGTHNLYFETDRYYRCMQAKEFRHPFIPTGYGRLGTDMEIRFVGPDPRAFDVDIQTDSWVSAGDGAQRTIAPGGNAFADPIFYFTVGGAGSYVFDQVLTNTTTGASFRLRGSVTGGDVIVVDCLDKTVEKAGDDVIALFDGDFLSLELGNNVLQHDTDSGSAPLIITKWQRRYF